MSWVFNSTMGLLLAVSSVLFLLEKRLPSVAWWTMKEINNRRSD